MTLALPDRLVDEAELVALARRLAAHVGQGGTILLRGDLGAGKTTFARALLGALGVGTRIKSPTYSLVESYDVADLSIHHLDLYRISSPEELEYLGLDGLADGRFLVLAEWPERAGDALPAADLTVHLAHAGARRALRMQPHSQRGQEWMDAIQADAAA